MIEQNLFTGKVVVEAALRGVGGYYNIADRGATISICGKQFHGFLGKQNMIVKKVSSPISESLKSYQKNVGDLAKALGNMRSMKRLEEIQELRPVRELMILMGDALDAFKGKVTYRFLSGQHKGGVDGL